MYTEQQSRLMSAIISLQSNAPNIVSFRFMSKQRDGSSSKPSKAEALREGYRVYVYLPEAYTPIELDQWAEAIVNAEDLVGLIEKEKAHEQQNPNFFKAISAKINNLYPQRDSMC
jgi:hypothetical protein